MRHPVDGGAKSDGEGKANVYSLCVGSSRSMCSNSHVTLMTLRSENNEMMAYCVAK